MDLFVRSVPQMSANNACSTEKVFNFFALVFAALTLLSMFIFGSGFVIPPFLEIISRSLAIIYAKTAAFCFLFMILFGFLSLFCSWVAAQLFQN